MIDLSKAATISSLNSSSKGNQLKWQIDGEWYKADNNGYEGLSEYVVSQLLKKSTLKHDEFVDYELCEIKYKGFISKGCKSKNFLCAGSSLITLQRLYEINTGKSLTSRLAEISSPINKAKYLVDAIISITKLSDFGEYLYKMMLIDSVFLNEDRHLHNIAVIKKDDGSFAYCPIFDNGAALLSDTKFDYPLSGNVTGYISSMKSKTIDESFMDTVDAFEKLYPAKINFDFDENDVDKIVDSISIYDEDIKKRVKQIIKYQRNKNLFYF